MTKIIFALQASFNTPEYGSSIGQAISVLFKIAMAIVIIVFIYKLIKPKTKK